MLPKPLDVTLAYKAIALAHKLSGTEKAVVGAILDHFNRRTGQCDPSLDRVAFLVGVSRRTVMRCMPRIEQTGILRKTRHGGYSQRNSYQPVWTRIRTLEAAWQRRFRNKNWRDLEGSNGGKKCHLPGDKSATQTCPTNQSTRRDTKSASSKFDNADGLGKQKKNSTGNIPKAVRANRVVPQSQSSKDAVRTVAEGRWHSDLLNQFSRTPAVYADIVDRIDPALQNAATDAEIRRRGGGLAHILGQLGLRQINRDGNGAAKAAAIPPEAPTGGGGSSNV